jgi:hypothetical protein
MLAANLEGQFDQAAKEEPASPPTVDKETASKEEHIFFCTLLQQVLLCNDLPDDQKGLALSLQEAME